MTQVRLILRPMSWIRASLLGLALTFMTHLATAGALTVRDGARLLSSADVTTLETAVHPYPFDVLVVTSSNGGSKEEFDRRIMGDVRANALVIGIDEAHRHTSVRFGTGLGVDRAQFRPIEEAGSSHFRQRQWRSGIDAIASRANQHAHGSGVGAVSSPAAGAPEATRSSENTGSLGGRLVVILVVAVGVMLAISILRKMLGKSRDARGGGPTEGPQGGNGYGPQGNGNGPGPFGAGYGPGYGGGGAGGGGSGLGAGLIGAGLGGLAGYELGRMAERHENESEGHRHSPNDYDTSLASTERNGDAGGASSDWDSPGTKADLGSSGWDDSDSSGGGGDWSSGDSGSDDSGSGDSGSGDGGADW